MSFKILAVLYTEFNIEKGPELVYQTPPNYIKQEDFKRISEFVVPLSKFCNKEISLHLGNAYLLGFPIFLNNQIYERNRFEFNFCILVDEEDYENNNYLYQSLIKKIDMTFENLEISYNFRFMKKSPKMIRDFVDILYSEFNSNKSILNIHIEEAETEENLNISDLYEFSSNRNKSAFNKENKQKNKFLKPLEKISSEDNFNKSKTDMPKIQLINDNNLGVRFSHSSCKEITKKNERKKNHKIINFSFRYIDFKNIKINILNYWVPAWIKEVDKEEVNKLDHLSIAIINKINGINSVKKISDDSIIGLDLVKYVLYSLYIMGEITFVDIFNYSNIYKPTMELKEIKVEGLYNRFKLFSILNQNDNKLGLYFNEVKNNNNDTLGKFIDDNKFFSYYILLSNSKDVKSFLDKVNNFELNLPLFIAFGVYLGIIRRIHLFFVIKKILKSNDDIIILMDGKHSEDEICVEKGIDLEILKKKYNENKDGNIRYFLYK